MVLSDFDQSRFFLYAGRILELEEALAQAESPVELKRYIEEWERSTWRGGGDGDSIAVAEDAPRPRPIIGGEAKEEEGDI